MVAFLRRRTASLLGCVLASVAGATAPPTSQPDDPIAQLVAQLSDPHWQVRSHASEGLIELADAARPRLQSLLQQGADLSLRIRIESVLRRIELVRQFGATPATLHLRSATAREAFDALLAQADLKLSDHGEMLDRLSGPAITLDVDHKPLWLALRELCSLARVQVDSVSQDGELSLDSGQATWSSRPAVCQGPFLVIARQLDLTRRVDQSGAVEYDLSLLAYVEPKLHPICWSIAQVQCVTDTGKPILIGRRRYWGAGFVNCSTPTRLQLVSSDDRARKLARLRFTASFVLQTGSEKIEVPNILSVRSETRLVGGWRILIGQVIQSGEGHYTAAVSVFRDGHTATEWAQLLGVIGRFPPRVIDARGVELRSWGGSRSIGDEEWTLTDRLIRNPPGAEPSKVIWEFPTSLKQMQVPIEFRGLRLPQ